MFIDDEDDEIKLLPTVLLVLNLFVQGFIKEIQRRPLRISVEDALTAFY